MWKVLLIWENWTYLEFVFVQFEEPLHGETTGVYPRVRVDAALVPPVGHASGVLLTETIRTVGLDRAASRALSPWRKPLAVHDPGKVVLDLTIMLALGGNALSDIATLRAEPGASDPTVSRVIAALAEDADRALAAIDTAHSGAREAAWALAGGDAPGAAAPANQPLIVGLDATPVTSHSGKGVSI